MALFKVSKSYMGDSSGLKDLGTSSAVQAATLAAAQAVARNAEAIGQGAYSAYPVTVIAGWNNERLSLIHI